MDLHRVGDIGWFTDLEPDLLETWSRFDVFTDQFPLLKRSLLVGQDDGGSGCYWLLHADSVREDGEWTAYEWWPGDGDDPEPYDDFATLVREAANT
ncbi:hypothetical protein [Streptomyces albus]|uniref:hypothetical protein n=1 Tax=Streptomyces sp. PHES57 TaxID=2872626 RepID=UPI001CED6A7F|nr:hypothetical protein [Streptomyces sp. PHES57]